MGKGYFANIQDETVNNTYFRKVLYTGTYTQLVVMNLKPHEEIGLEVHEKVDQFFRVEAGSGKAVIDGVETNFKEEDVIIVPAGSMHNIINTSDNVDLKLYTLYSPPNHPEGTIHKTLAEAQAAEEHGHK